MERFRNPNHQMRIDQITRTVVKLDEIRTQIRAAEHLLSQEIEIPRWARIARGLERQESALVLYLIRAILSTEPRLPPSDQELQILFDAEQSS